MAYCLPKINILDSEYLKLKIMQMGASVVGIGNVSTGLAPEFFHMPGAISLGMRIEPSSYYQKNDQLQIYDYFSVHIDKKLQEIQKKRH